MSDLQTPRYETAGSEVPGNPLFWTTVLNQSDIFAFNTANEGKGGPFGAQLWLVNPETEQYILVGKVDHLEDSNAVVSKGRASAHAEAENLSPEKRQDVVDFLSNKQGDGWQLFQVSSGESCPSCRSKQVAFAEELIQEGLIEKGGFHVIFKATYDQTKRDADFNDAPYDQTFRAISLLNILDNPGGLISLEETLKADPIASKQINSGELVYNPVNLIEKANDLPNAVKGIFDAAGEHPAAVILEKDGSILSIGYDRRGNEGDHVLNAPEQTAIVSALYNAAQELRENEGKFESWNLDGATLYTNIRDIGPMAYSESLWYNLASINISSAHTGDLIDEMAQEVPGIRNTELFKHVAVDYDSPVSPLTVIFNGNPLEASVAHLLWKAKMAMETLKNNQGERLEDLADQGIKNIQLIDGTVLPLIVLVGSSNVSSNYDGKAADPVIT